MTIASMTSASASGRAEKRGKAGTPHRIASHHIIVIMSFSGRSGWDASWTGKQSEKKKKFEVLRACQ